MKRRSTTISFWAACLVLILGSSCSNESKKPEIPDGGSVCGVCSSGQACDTASKTCVTAAPEGTRCGADAPDGGPTICQTGLSCEVVATGHYVCSHDCTANVDCPGRTCVTNPSNLPPHDYCVTTVVVGQACNPDQLIQCDKGFPTEGCIVGTNGQGQCFNRCSTSADCPSGQGCTALFSDGKGVCVPASSTGNICDQNDLSFCSAPLVCVVETGTRGICHTRCDNDAGACATNEQCVALDPCGDLASICVQPVATDSSCDPTNDLFCSLGDDCVNLNGRLTCRPDCTDSDTCSLVGASCHPLPTVDGGSCRSACF